MDAPARTKVSVRVEREGGVPPCPGAMCAEDPVTIVIFGASGDLSKRRLIPALFRLQNSGYLPERYAVLGFSRTAMTDEAYRESVISSLPEYLEDPAEEVKPANPLVRALYYQPGDSDDREAFARLKEKIEQLEKELQLPGNRLFYLSVAPALFPSIVKNLSAAGLIYDRHAPTWSRVVIEKPFGSDLRTAQELTATITEVLEEHQIYRIDHYLGKETVQNILSFRFGNSIFEPLFNRRYVDEVQITVAERLGMEGKRGAYYDTAGALRDVVQNHMLQLLCLIAMEPPSALEAQAVRDEKVKVLRALVPFAGEKVVRWTVRGQYGVGEENGDSVKGYRQEFGVDPHSVTETYVALRARIDNWRWAGVPFFLRSGKRLRARASEVAVKFKQPPLRLFRELGGQESLAPPEPRSNLLVMRIQPDEGISLSFACKRPGMQVQLEEVDMDFFYGEAFRQRSPEAYERLLLDALRGDASLFTRSDEVEYAWRFITSIHEGWAKLPPPVFPNYYPFTDGPDEAHRLMKGRSSRWRPMSEMSGG